MPLLLSQLRMPNIEDQHDAVISTIVLGFVINAVIKSP